jgi:hypothetical protein
VKTWSSSRSVPSLKQAAKLQAHTGLSLDWLVTGKGPELHGSPVPTGDAAATLRAHLVATLAPEFGGVVEALPSADVLLGEVLSLYRERVAAIVQGRRRRGLLDQIGKATDRGTRVLLSAMLRAMEERDPFAHRVPVPVAPDDLEALGIDPYGGGGATPEWNVPLVEFVPQDG